MTFTKKFRNILSIFILYAMEILHPANVITDCNKMLTAKEYKLLK